MERKAAKTQQPFNNKMSRNSQERRQECKYATDIRDSERHLQDKATPTPLGSKHTSIRCKGRCHSGAESSQMDPEPDLAFHSRALGSKVLHEPLPFLSAPAQGGCILGIKNSALAKAQMIHVSCRMRCCWPSLPPSPRFQMLPPPVPPISSLECSSQSFESRLSFRGWLWTKEPLGLFVLSSVLKRMFSE